MALRITFYKSPSKSLLVGFALHAIGNLVNVLIGSDILLAIICLIGWIFIIKGFVLIPKHFQLTGLEAALYALYLIICMVMIIRGYCIDYQYPWISFNGLINFHLFAPTYILPYLMPLVVFIPFKYYNFSYFLRIATVFAVISIILFLVFMPRIFYESQLLAAGYDGDNGFGAQFAYIYVPFAFIVLCSKYIKKSVWIINSIALFLSLMMYMVAARRGASVTTACLFILNIYLLYKNIHGREKAITTIIIAIFGAILIWTFINGSAFDYIQKRGFEDTRSGVDEALMAQMTPIEKFFGKGLNGRYYYPITYDDIYSPWGGWRYGSETGFYNIVLKGGYLMAFVYILLLAIPAIKGLLMSNNILCKAGGFYILLSLVELYPFGWLAFNMKFLIIWMFVAMLGSRSIRHMNDIQIYNMFFNKQ